MLQLTNEEKEIMSIFTKKHNVELRIYFSKDQTQVFMRKDNDKYEKIYDDKNVSFQDIFNILEKIR